MGFSDGDGTGCGLRLYESQRGAGTHGDHAGDGTTIHEDYYEDGSSDVVGQGDFRWRRPVGQAGSWY